MSNMESLETQLSEKERQKEIYAIAMRAIEAKAKCRAESGYAVMAAAARYGVSAPSNNAFGKISHAAKLFCIGFAFLVPGLLVRHVLL